MKAKVIKIFSLLVFSCITIGITGCSKGQEQISKVTDIDKVFDLEDIEEISDSEEDESEDKGKDFVPAGQEYADEEEPAKAVVERISEKAENMLEEEGFIFEKGIITDYSVYSVEVGEEIDIVDILYYFGKDDKQTDNMLDLFAYWKRDSKEFYLTGFNFDMKEENGDSEDLRKQLKEVVFSDDIIEGISDAYDVCMDGKSIIYKGERNTKTNIHYSGRSVVAMHQRESEDSNGEEMVYGVYNGELHDKDGFFYADEDGEAVIIREKKQGPFIPEEVDGLPVVRFVLNAEELEEASFLAVGSTVKEFGCNLNSCDEEKVLFLPENVEVITSAAFYSFNQIFAFNPDLGYKDNVYSRIWDAIWAANEYVELNGIDNKAFQDLASKYESIEYSEIEDSISEDFEDTEKYLDDMRIGDYSGLSKYLESVEE